MNRSSDRGKVLVAYLTALVVALAIVHLVEGTPLWVAALADGIATVVVFGFSWRWDNSSVYDPYWSAAPPLLGLYWLVQADPATAIHWLMLGLVTLWAVRLTWNWVDRWRGFEEEDWRYLEIRRATGGWYWPASLFGIHLLPTAMVFLGCLPLAFALMDSGTPSIPWLVLAAAVTTGSIALEAVADAQLRAHRRSGVRQPLTSGIWSWSRHPNYLGEMGFWWGLWLFAVAFDPAHAWTGVGALVITVLFVFYSIPAMDRRVRDRNPTGEAS